MTYVDLLNEDEDDDIYSARRLNDSEADALGLEDHEDSFEIDEAIEDMTAEDEDEE